MKNCIVRPIGRPAEQLVLAFSRNARPNQRVKPAASDVWGRSAAEHRRGLRAAVRQTEQFLAAFLVLAKLFSEDFPSAITVATTAFLALWLALTGFNMWVGVAKAGYSVAEELPILLLLFGLPAAVAVVLRWKVL